MSKIANAPSVPNNGGFETRAAASPRVSASSSRGSDSNAAMPAYAFELRVVQEQGTH